MVKTPGGAADRRGDSLASLARRLWFPGKDRPPWWWGMLQGPLGLAEGVGRVWLVAVNGAYTGGWRREKRVPLPVVSVGNLTVGGSGKSSFCLFLADRFRSLKRRAAMVSHSYGREGGSAKPVVFSGQGGVPPWTDIGDEAAMMADEAPWLTVVAGADKAASVERAAETGAEVIVIDDAFHRRDIHRDLDILLFDSILGLGNGHVLPRGPLREPPQALIRADAFVISLPGPGPVPSELEDLIRRENPVAPILTSVKVPTGLETWPGKEKLPLGRLSGCPVLAFSAIGSPGNFREVLARTGARVVAEAAYRDHHRFTSADLADTAEEAARAGAELVVTTAKDAVRIGSWPQGAVPLTVLRVAARISDPEQWLEARLAGLFHD